MSDTHHYSTKTPNYSSGKSASASPSNATVPSINIAGSPASPGSPVGEFLGRSLDIKKQLSQSFHGHSNSIGGGLGPIPGGGISKPRSRRNSTHHIKSEETGGIGTEDNDPEGGKEDQGIERKRRDNINEKIQELLTLIPSEYFQEQTKEANALGSAGAGATPGQSSSSGYDEALAMAKSTGTRDGKPNKGQILTQAVEYIQHLQNLIDENNRKEVELFLQMKTLQNSDGNPNNSGSNIPIAVGATSAEKALGEIGVGPESDEYFRKVLLESSGTFKTETG
ncbi:hypothetical protein JCM33374_g3850 [Metschnikowia sp. JCM 33374]|nr:hypothetical protein JCM33374_g3850 [Metschnikowia sp. JCM 33374]